MTSIGTFAPGTGGLQTITVSIPPAGTDWDYSIPLRTRMRPICGRCVLTTSAAVATRRVQLYCLRTGDLICRSANYGGQLAGVSQPYSITPGNDIANAFPGYDIFIVFPPGLILVGLDTIGVTTTLIDAADQWSNIFLRFEQWIEV